MSKTAETPPEKCIESYNYIFRNDLLRGNVALITGGGTGIGFTITEVLMRHGCDTAIASRRLHKCQESASILMAATGRQCLPLQMDVRNPKTIIEAVEAVMKKYGRIDILVNNAAGNFLCPAASLSFNAFRTVMDIDAMGTFNVTKVVFDQYMKVTCSVTRRACYQGWYFAVEFDVPPRITTLQWLPLSDHGGVIINITATLQIRGQAFQTHAGAAKAAIETITKHLAVEWGEKGIRLMCVAPGPIEDTEGYNRLGGRTIKNTQYERSIPIQRVGTKEEIANTVLYITSDAAKLLTGTTIIADGGAWLTGDNSVNTLASIMQQNAKLDAKL